MMKLLQHENKFQDILTFQKVCDNIITRSFDFGNDINRRGIMMFENDNNNSGIENAQFDEMSVSGVDNITKKGKGKKAALIGGISAAVIVGGSAAAYGLSDTVKNQVKLRLSKPEKYYAWVTENNSEALAELLSGKYKDCLDKYEKEQNIKIKFSYAPTEEAKNKILEEILGSDYEKDADEEEQQLINVIKKHDEYAFATDISSNHGKVNSNVGVDLSGDRVMSFEAAADMDAFDFFFRIPELKEQWIGFNVDVKEELEDTEFESIIDCYKDILNDPASYLTPEQLKNEIARYTGVWSSFADDVNVEKKESVDISDITVDYTVATVEMTEKDITQLSIDMLEKLRDDKYIKELVTEKLDVVDEADYDEELNDAIDDLKEDLESDDDEDIVFTVDTYIDFTGTVRGFRFTNEYDDEFFMAIGMDDSNARGELTFKEDGEETFSAKLSLDDVSMFKKHQTYSGDVVITGEDIDGEVKVEFDNVKEENDEKFYFSGDFVINIPDVDPICISCKSNGKKQEIAYDLRIDDIDYGKIAVEYSYDYGVDVEFPSEKDAYMINSDDIDGFELENYVSQKDFSKFLDELLDKVGITGDTAKDISENITEDLYDEVSDALDDDDDFDWDEDDDFKVTTSVAKGTNKTTTTTEAYDDDDMYNFDDFDWDSLKYEDYKDFMTEEEFKDFVNEMKEYSEEYKKAS